jgi:subtilisin family serine protease
VTHAGSAVIRITIKSVITAMGALALAGCGSRGEETTTSNALAAYDRGYTGAGIKAAVIDTGIDVANSPLAGRIDPASTDTAGNGTLNDINGHGTAVALLLAARRDGVGSHWVAFAATIVAFRADLPGTCARRLRLQSRRDRAIWRATRGRQVGIRYTDVAFSI